MKKIKKDCLERRRLIMKTVKLQHLYLSILICVVVTNAMVISLIHAAQTIPSVQRLEEGIAAYEHGEYDDAIFKLEMSVYQIQEEEREDLWDAHFYLGLSYCLTGDKDEARKQFIKAQGIMKNKSPDSDIHSPKIVKLFKDTLKQKQDAVRNGSIRVKSEPKKVDRINDIVEGNKKQIQDDIITEQDIMQVFLYGIETRELVIDALSLTRNGLELERVNSDEVEVKRIKGFFIQDIDERVAVIKDEIVDMRSKLGGREFALNMTKEDIVHMQIEGKELVIDALTLTRDGLKLKKANSDEVEVIRIIEVFLEDIDERVAVIKDEIVDMRSKFGGREFALNMTKEDIVHMQIEGKKLVIDALFLTRNGLELERANSDEVEVKRIIGVFIQDIDKRIAVIIDDIKKLKK